MRVVEKVVGTLALAGMLMIGGCDSEEQRAAADQRVAEEALESWRKLSHCLVGDPLGDGEKASERMRLSDLRLIVTGAQGDWPKSCVELVVPLLERLEALQTDAAVGRFSALRTQLGMLKDTDPAVYVADAEAPLVDGLFDAAQEAGLEPPPADAPKLPEGSPKAPPPAEPLARDKVALLGESDGYIARVELAPGNTVRFMLGTEDNKKAFYCRIDSKEKPLDSAECKALDPLPTIVSMPLSAETSADFYWDSKPKSAIWGLDGSSIEGAFGPSAFVYENGQIADIHETPTGPELIRQIPSRGVQKAPMPKVPGGKWIGFRAGAAVSRGPILGNVFKSAVVVHDVGSGTAAVSGKVESGLVPPDIKYLEGCRQGGTLSLALVGEPSKRQKEPERTVAMLFHDKDGWTDSVFGRVVFPEDADWEATWWRSFSCRGKEGVLTWVMDDKVHQLRCTPEGCAEKHSAPLPASDRSQKLRVADLAGNALVVRVLRAKVPLGGVSDAVVMRLGPVEKLATAPEQVILGDASHLGLPHLDKSLGLVDHDGVAVLLIHGDPKVYGVRIDAEGKASKLTVK